ncbi:MAG: peptide ABC transporter substrate-binding protein [Bacteroides sp.]|nr:peptide ABC transporter substrate-binding protein [Bacteroides sp.]
MKYKRIIKAVLSLALAGTLTLTSACKKDDGTGYIFKYDIASNPVTLDPQTASDSSSYEIIANMFEGLLKVDNEGSIQNAAAESYTVSDDGLVYTFKLREDICWYDGDEFETPCTADDFVFAFQRLFRPTTKSKTASGFFCIKNSEQINRGYITDITELGVKALDEYTLEITLNSPNPSFPVMLTTPPAMPCSREFYESSGGKYGLYGGSVASNGAFYIYRWNYDKWSTDNNNIIMRVNTKNNGNNDISPYGLNFFIEEADSYQNFLNEQSHVYIASGAEAIQLLNLGYDNAESETRIWGVLFNTKSKSFENESLRQALAYSIQRDALEINSVGYGKAAGIVPAAINIGEHGYRELAEKDCFLPYNSLLSEQAINEALDSVSKNSWSGLTVYVPDDDVIYEYISDISQMWQSELNFYCNVKRLPDTDYESVLLNGDFDFIVADISGNFNSPYSYLSSFSSSGGSNYSGYVNSSFNALLSRAENAADEKQSAELYYQAEKTIVDSAVFIPLLNQSEYAFFGEDCLGIVYNPFTKTVIFKEAKKF